MESIDNGITGREGWKGFCHKNEQVNLCSDSIDGCDARDCIID